MAHESIPDAQPGAAPDLEHPFFRQRLGRLVPSAGGESAHSVALTTLSNKGLEGVPIAQKVGDKQFRYFDTQGKEITKQDAMEMAGGIVYYQEIADPSKGRLRFKGSFVGVPEAQSIVPGSRAGSDAADLSSIEENDASLSSIEENDTSAADVDDSAKGAKRTPGPAIRRMILLALAAVAFASLINLTPASSQEMVLKQVVGLHVGCFDTAASHAGCSTQYDISNCADGALALSPHLRQLLDTDERNESPIEIEALKFIGDAESALKDRRNLAEAEVDRILATSKVSEILGSGPLREQQQEFHRIAHLLHPDKGLVSPGDLRASLALRLTFAARRRATKPRD